ncbi:hypothetical protein CR194_06475 [Salipaludibacillus keqinensis]|uniref:Uncharacterized protein n=1 Tax=Salipaludibacillus keqinensis TaxID=2045207 RepID=A0A323TZY2_9BACI|nr:hypothetical protein [Salipaludibacillus keqinensis]PYZ95155.1 hypothetical protein CR194_06475 [Salipaludibacillus keqinensis]
MHDSVISIHDLFPGMELESDIYDQFNHLLIRKGTILTTEHMKRLTNEQQTYFIYRMQQTSSARDVELLANQLTLFLKRITFVEELGIDLDEMRDNYYFPEPSLTDPNWKEKMSCDFIQKVNYAFIEKRTEHLNPHPDHISKEHLVYICEQIAYWLNEAFWKKSINPLEFYQLSIEKIGTSTEGFIEFWQQYFVPLPEGAVVLLKDGRECEVSAVSVDKPFSPLLTYLDNQEGKTYFVEDISGEIEYVQPMIILSLDDRNQ